MIPSGAKERSEAGRYAGGGGGRSANTRPLLIVGRVTGRGLSDWTEGTAPEQGF